MKYLLTILLLPLTAFPQLITTNWGETNNFYVPQGCYAGNRSVAVAQILNYWQHPNQGWGDVEYNSIWVEDEITCDFENQYEWQNQTQDDKDWLVFAAGASCKHQFSPYLQNSMCDIYNLDTIRQALVQYWGFKQGVITTDTALIISDIQDGKPVLLESLPIYPQLGCARYFILDGYNNGLFHVNNSFGGMFNGWYEIGNIVFMGTHYNYNKALTGIEPDSMEISGYVMYEGLDLYIVGHVDLTDSLWTPIQDEGYFNITVPRGWYCTHTVCTLPWGRSNSVDALLILKMFAGLDSLGELANQAANVNLDYSVNTTDALLTARRFVGLISGFPSGDWLFSEGCVNNDALLLILGRCYGDVN